MVVDAAFVERAALSYLNRFDATGSKLRRVLLQRAAKNARLLAAEERPGEQEIEQWVDDLLARYRRSGVIDDYRYASNLIRSLHERGCSSRMIRQKLRAKGVAEPEAERALVEAVEGEHPDSEFAAACNLVKRRRLGSFSESDRKDPAYRRALGTLARAGFDFDTAMRALAASRSS